jgi:hypothetical protein
VAAVRTSVNARDTKVFMFLPPDVLVSPVLFPDTGELDRKLSPYTAFVRIFKNSLKISIFFVAFLSIHMYNRSVIK